MPRRKPSLHRSAGACPPRSPDRHEKRPIPRGRGRFLSRSMHGEGQALSLRWPGHFPLSRSAGACPPRSSDLNEKRPMPRGRGHFLSRSMHGEGQALALRLTRTVSYNGDGFLLPYQHLLRCREISRLQRIEIHPTCNRFSLCITAIPIRRSALALIDTGNLMSQC